MTEDFFGKQRTLCHSLTSKCISHADIETMNFDFDARESKFERERRQRAEAARQKRAEEEARRAQHARKQQEMQGES